MEQPRQEPTQNLQLHLHPNRRAFLAVSLISAITSFIIFGIAIIIASLTIESWISLAFFPLLGIVAYQFANAFSAYQKQRYEFGKNAADYGDGNLFTNRDTELRYENITHVQLIKPFIEYHLFGTGKILIEAAGSQQSAIVLRSIDHPFETFQQIRTLLARETFALTYAELRSQKQPSPLAVVLQLLGGLIAAFFFLLTTGLGTIISLASDLPTTPLLLIALAVGVGFLIYFYASYQDQRRRTYSVYSDVIHYSKGFLTKQEAFIPAENLANTQMTQNFVGKLLDLQDIIISCQGSGSEISFANLRGAEDMRAVITTLINHRSSQSSAPNEKDTTAEASTTPTNATSIASKFTAPPTPLGEDVSAQDFSMDIPRTLLGTLPLIIFPPLLVLVAAQQYITAKRTVFRLTEGGVASYYSFLSSKNVEFSREKITGLLIKRNPLDRWLGTVTITFWSIGSGETVDFKNIPYDAETSRLMKTKAGITSDEELETIRPKFSFTELCRSSLFTTAVVATFFLVGIILTLIVSPLLWLLIILLSVIAGVYFFILHRRYSGAFLRLGQHTVALGIGILFHTEFYARYDNVKTMTLQKYPDSTLGTIRFDIAGERSVADQNGGTQTLANHFSLAFLPDVAKGVRGESVWLDQVLLHKPDAAGYRDIKQKNAPEALHMSRPALKNSLLTLIPIHVILFPLLVILPLSIFLRAYWLRRVSYQLEKDRVVKRSGIIYRKQTSILLSRLDYTETGQNFTNKVCKNGNIYLYTAGSSNAELVLKNIPDYQEFHQVLKSHME